MLHTHTDTNFGYMMVQPHTDTNWWVYHAATRTLTLIGGYMMVHTHTDTNCWVYDGAPAH